MWHLHRQRLDVVNLLGDREREQRCLDRLERWLRLYPGPQQELDLLVQRTRFHIDTGDLNQAFELSGPLLDMARGSGERHRILQCLEWRAMIHRERSEVREALALYDEARQYIDGEEQLASLLHEKGLSLSYAGRLTDAQRDLEAAMALAVKYHDIDTQGSCYNDQGINLAKQGHKDQAVRSYQLAIACFRKTGYKLGMAMTAGNVAEAYLDLGEFQQALCCARDCLRWGTEVEDLISQGLGHEIIGRVLAGTGELAGGERHLAQAERLAGQTGDAAVQLMILGQLVAARAMAGDPQGVGQYHDRLRELAATQDDRLGQAVVHLAAAALGRIAGDAATALQHLDAVLSRNVQVSYFKDDATLAKGWVLHEAGEHRRAKEWLDGADAAALKRRMQQLEYHALGMRVNRALADDDAAQRHRAAGRAILDELLARNPDPGMAGRILALPHAKTITGTGQ